MADELGLVAAAGNNPKLKAFVASGLKSALSMEAGVATSSAASAADPWLIGVGGGGTFELGGVGALVLPLLWHGVTFLLGQYAADKSLQGIESMLADYSQTVKALQASEKLKPGAARAGSIVGTGPRAIVSGIKLAQTGLDAAGNAGRTALAAGADPAAANAARLRAAAGAVLPPVAAGAGAGAAFELTVRPAVDGLLHQAADVLHIDHDPYQSPTLRSVLTSAVLGGLMSGENSPGQTGERPGQAGNSAQVSDIFGRWLQARQQGIPIEQALSPSEIGLLQNAAPRIAAALEARVKTITQDPAAFQESARQGLVGAGAAAERQDWQSFRPLAQAIQDSEKAAAGGLSGFAMAQEPMAIRPGRMYIGFMTTDGKLIGSLADPKVGHDMLASMMGVRSGNGLRPGVVAITVGKSSDGAIQSFGSGTFGPLSDTFKNLAKRLVK